MVDGVQGCWHLEHTAGADAVFTLPPAFLTDFLQRCGTLTCASRIRDDLPLDVVARLQRVPYFNRGYELGGILVDEFNEIPSLQSIVRDFSRATEDMVTFVREQVAPAVTPLA